MQQFLKQLRSEKQSYYYYLAQRCFAEFSRAEDYYATHQYPASAAALFHSSEFFWKALTVLSNQWFEEKHDADYKDIRKISDAILSPKEKIKVNDILTHFPQSRRSLAIYGYYEKGKATEPPSKVFTRDVVKEDLEYVRVLVNMLKRIHMYQVFTPPVRLGILSGYVEGGNDETICEEYTQSRFKKAEEWEEELKTFQTRNGARLFEPSLISVSDLSSGLYPIALNPFGETYPEKGKGEGIGFITISEYIRNGGIFINSAGHPFIYSWDVTVTEDNRQLVVSSIPTVLGFDVQQRQGRIAVVARGTYVIPPEALLLSRKFGVEAAWDVPDKGIIGPQELNIKFIEFAKELRDAIKARVFRPIKPSKLQNILPIVQTQTEYWGDVYPIAAISYGRGFLISTGMNLDEERECDILLKVIVFLAERGFELMATS